MIINFLKRKEQASVGDIASEMKLSFRATSRHLLLLSNVEILERDQRGPQIFYKIASPLGSMVRAIVSLL